MRPLDCGHRQLFMHAAAVRHSFIPVYNTTLVHIDIFFMHAASVRPKFLPVYNVTLVHIGQST